MAVTNKLSGQFPHYLLEDVFGNITSSTIKCALLTSAHTFNQETNDYWDDVSANEVSGTGYSAGGATLTSVTCAETTRVTTVDAADVSWGSSTITAEYAVIYESIGAASANPIIATIDFDGEKSSSSGTFQITFNASGILTITVAA